MNRISKTVIGFFLNFICLHAFSQTLTVNTNQITFGNVYENAPDSFLLSITNNLGKDVTVNNIRFYTIYGSPAFSASANNFVIFNGTSATVWIRFSPRHNIFHNSEMVIENDGLRGNISIDLRGQGKYSDSYYNLTENLSEENLKSVINLVTGNGYVSLGYNSGRDEMFMNIDNKSVNGQGASQNTLECVYTGREAIGYTDRSDCQTSFSFNTEHTFPQSFFTSAEPMKSDLHHLFPTDDVANNQRGDNPFGIVTAPSWSVGGSSSDGVTFEPRDVHKGAVARAMFYFVLRYQNYNNFLDAQEAILRTWDHNFPPTAIEKKRNLDVFGVQHNKNPFVDYPAFTDRITSFSNTSFAPLVSSIDLVEDTIVYGTLQNGIPAVYNFVIVNNGNTDIQFSNFNLTHPTELTFASTGNDTSIAPGDALTLQIRCLTSLNDSIRAFLNFNTDATGNVSVSVPIFVNDLIYSGIAYFNTSFSISPNPAHDHLTVSGNSITGFQWKLFNVLGKQVLSSEERNSVHTIDLNGTTPGVYILSMTENGNSVNRKIVIE